MFENFIKWRQENNVDSIAEKDVSYISKIQHLYPHGYYGTDRIGRPIYIERYEHFDLKKILELVPEEKILQYFIYGYERLIHVNFPACSKQVGKEIGQSVTILDLKGMNFTKVISKRKEITRFLKIASGIAQDNYPEIMGKMFVVNTPLMFKILWGIVKGFLDKKTLKKISILGSSYRKQLYECIDPKTLPIFLKGENETPLEEGTGPWANNFKDVKKYKTFDLEEIERLKKLELSGNQESNIPNNFMNKNQSIISEYSEKENIDEYSEFSRKDIPRSSWSSKLTNFNQINWSKKY